METKKQTNEGFLRGYPFQQRLANVSSRYKTLRSNADLWSVLAGIKAFDSIDEESQKLLPLGFSNHTGALTSDDLTHATKRLIGIRSQLKAATVIFADHLKSIESTITKIRAAFSAQNYNLGFQQVLELEKTELTACEQFSEQLNIIIKERLSQDRFMTSNVIDLLVADVYDQINTRAKFDRVSSSETSLLAPIPSTLIQTGTESPWASIQQMLWKQGRALPISLLPIAPRSRDQVWNLVRCYTQVCRKLYWDLGIDREIEQVIQNVSRRVFVSPQALQHLQTWRSEIVAEVCASVIAGPALAGASLEILADSAQHVSEMSLSPVGLPVYFRWKSILSSLEQLGFQTEVESYRRSMLTFFGPDEFVSTYPQPNPLLREVLACVDTLVGTLLHTPLMVLKGNTLRNFLPNFELTQFNQSLVGASEILAGVGLAPLANSVTDHSSTSAAGKTEKTRSSARASEKSATTKTEIVFDSQIVQHIAACRLAFERVSLGGEVPSRFEIQCRTYLSQLVDRINDTPEAVRTHKDISTEDVHRLVRVAYAGVRTQSLGSLGWV